MTEVDEHREWLLSLVDCPPGAAVLDLGCGKGGDLRRLAELIDDPRARFVGVDASADHLSVARSECADDRVSFIHSKIGGALEFEDDSFDVILSQELLECVPGVEELIVELARVLRPGGQLVVSHYDWDTQVFNGSDRDRTRRVRKGWSDWAQSWMDQADPWMGRRLWGYLQGSDLFDGEVHVRAMTNTKFEEPGHGFRLAHGMGSLATKGQFSQADYDGFIADLEKLDAEGRYFWSVNRYVYVGRRPAL